MKKFLASTLTASMVLSGSVCALAGEYVVKEGDYLVKIAQQYNTTWRELAELNSLTNPNFIYPGQILAIPTESNEVPMTELEPSIPSTPVPDMSLEETAPEEMPVEEIPVEETLEEALEEETQEEVLMEEEIGLTALMVEDITHTGNEILPEFDMNEDEYIFNVQSDIYGVKVTPSATDGAIVTVDGEEVIEGEGLIVNLSQEYEDYDLTYTQNIEIEVSKDDVVKTYNVEVVREDNTDIYNLFEEITYTDEETGIEMPAQIYVPSNYDETKEYPVVINFHGTGQRTQTPDMLLKRYEMATVWAEDSENGINEAIVIAPQCATEDPDENWTSLLAYRNGVAEDAFEVSDYGHAAYNLLMDVVDEYSVDEDRIYMTGLSAGGFAAYGIAAEYPETFAAIVPICGGLDPSLAENLEGIDIWSFHAEGDPSVNVDEYYYPSIEALEDAEIEFRTTLYEEGSVFTPSAHFSWTPAYANEDMRTWLFEQTK